MDINDLLILHWTGKAECGELTTSF